MRSWRVVPIVATCKIADRISHCAYFFGPPGKFPLLLSISPEILHDFARNLNRLGKPKQGP
jgi:hypothetical protein